MAKKLSAKTGEYTNDQNEVKGRYTNVGVIIQKDGDEFILLDPCVSLAGIGILASQNALAMTKGQPVRDRVMISIYDEQQNQQTQQQPQQGYQQQPNQMQQPQQQQYQQQTQGY
jgi:hypothetical protein